MGVAADAVLPKDETPGASLTADTGDAGMNQYDMLYVGADGKTTANGGELVAYYSAIGENVSTVDLGAKTWKDKLGKAADATFKGDGWYTLPGGGFGYTFSVDSFKAVSGSYGLSLPENLLLPNLYIETLGRATSFLREDGQLIEVQSGGLRYNDSASNNYTSFVRVDLLSSVFFIGIPRKGTCEQYGNRFYLSYKGFSQFHSSGIYPSGSYADTVYTPAAISNGYKPVILTAQYGRTTAADGTETYTVGYPIGETKTLKLITAADKAALKAETTSDKAGKLSFFNGIPSDVYAIRVYNAPLTQTEKEQNAAADVLAYAGADLTKYLALSSHVRDIVNGMLAAGGIVEDKQTLAGKLDEIFSLVEESFDITETLTCRMA